MDGQWWLVIGGLSVVACDWWVITGDWVCYIHNPGW